MGKNMKQFFLDLLVVNYIVSNVIFVVYQVLILFRIGVLAFMHERAGLGNTELGLIFPTLLFIGMFVNFISSYYTYHSKVSIAMLFGIIGLSMSCLVFIYFSVFYYIIFALWMVIIVLPFLLILIMSIIFLICSKFIHFTGEEKLIKNTILDFSTELDKRRNTGSSDPRKDRITLHDLSKRCNIDEDSIIYFIMQMIKNNEINGAYFKSSRTLIFKHEVDMIRFNSLMGD